MTFFSLIVTDLVIRKFFSKFWRKKLQVTLFCIVNLLHPPNPIWYSLLLLLPTFFSLSVNVQIEWRRKKDNLLFCFENFLFGFSNAFVRRLRKDRKIVERPRRIKSLLRSNQSLELLFFRPFHAKTIFNILEFDFSPSLGTFNEEKFWHLYWCRSFEHLQCTIILS